MSDWADAGARARGLSTHLLDRSRIEALARSPDLRALTRRLRTAAYPLLAETSDALAAERDLRREAGRRLSLLERWLGGRREQLVVLLDAEDLRTIRTLLRGAAQGASADARLAGLLPSTALPPRALEELAEAPSPSAVAERLHAMGHPFGSFLVEEGPEVGGLLGLELRLARGWARRAVAGARHRDLRRFVRRAVDLANAWTALAACGERDVAWQEAFLEGGAALGAETFRSALDERERAGVLARLARAFAESPLAAVFRDAASGDTGSARAALELRALRALIAVERRLARSRPLGPAPVLHYVLRLRLELETLRLLVWGLALDAPPPILLEELPRVA